MQADDLYELLTFWQVLNDLTEHNKQLLDELDAEAQALDTQRQQAEAAATQAEQAAQALQARQDELTQTQIQLEQALQQASTELDSQQAAAKAQAAVTEEKRKAYEQATAALDAYLKVQSQKYQDPARHCSLDFTCPLPAWGASAPTLGSRMLYTTSRTQGPTCPPPAAPLFTPWRMAWSARHPPGPVMATVCRSTTAPRMTVAAMPPCMRTCPAFASARGRRCIRAM